MIRSAQEGQVMHASVSRIGMDVHKQRIVVSHLDSEWFTPQGRFFQLIIDIFLPAGMIYCLAFPIV